MSLYKKALVALELDNGCDEAIIANAESLKEQGAELFLVHAIEYLSTSAGAAYGVSLGVEIEAVVEQANKLLNEIGSRLGVPSENLIIKSGPAKYLILDEAKRLAVDLIILGSHGRHGVRLLLGSTANAVLHGAICDVLAVRL